MNCDMNFEELMAYVDAELGSEDRRRVAQHLVECPECRTTVDDLKAVSGVLTKWVTPEPVALPTAQELLARVSRPDDKAPGGGLAGFATRWGALAASLVIAMFLGVLFVQKYGTGELAEKAPMPGQSVATEGKPGSPADGGASPPVPASRAAAPDPSGAQNPESRENPAKLGEDTSAAPGGMAGGESTFHDAQPATTEDMRAREAKEEERKRDDPSGSADNEATDAFAATPAPVAQPAPPATTSPVNEPKPAAPAEQPDDKPSASRSEGFGRMAGGAIAVSHTERITTDDEQSVLSRVSSIARHNDGSVISRSSSGGVEYVRIRVRASKLQETISDLRGIGSSKKKAKAPSAPSDNKDDGATKGGRRDEDDRARKQSQKTVVVIVETEN